MQNMEILLNKSMVAGWIIVLVIHSAHAALSETVHTSSRSCYGDAVNLINSSCSTGEAIVISEVKAGAKPTKLNCSDSNYINENDTAHFEECCGSLESTDCVFDIAFTPSSGYTTACNGKQQCKMQAMRFDVNAGVCNRTIYPAHSNLMYLNHFCIAKERIVSMCSTDNVVSNSDPVYIQSPTTITSEYVACSCSIETDNCSSKIQAYTIQMLMQPSNTSGNCSTETQSLNITMSDGSTFIKWDCSNQSVRITEHTVSDTYLVLNFANSYPADGGSFWLSFQPYESSANISINCPAVEQQHCRPSTTTSVTTTTTTTTTTNTTKTATTTTTTATTTTAESTVTEAETTDATITIKTVATTTQQSIDCGPPPIIANGKLQSNYNNTSVGAQASLMCDTGYVASQEEIKCEVSGKWEKATCQTADVEKVSDSDGLRNGIIVLGVILFLVLLLLVKLALPRILQCMKRSSAPKTENGSISKAMHSHFPDNNHCVGKTEISPAPPSTAFQVPKSPFQEPMPPHTVSTSVGINTVAVDTRTTGINTIPANLRNFGTNTLYLETISVVTNTRLEVEEETEPKLVMRNKSTKPLIRGSKLDKLLSNSKTAKREAESQTEVQLEAKPTPKLKSRGTSPEVMPTIDHQTRGTSTTDIPFKVINDEQISTQNIAFVTPVFVQPASTPRDVTPIESVTSSSDEFYSDHENADTAVYVGSRSFLSPAKKSLRLSRVNPDGRLTRSAQRKKGKRHKTPRH